MESINTWPSQRSNSTSLRLTVKLEQQALIDQPPPSSKVFWDKKATPKTIHNHLPRPLIYGGDGSVWYEAIASLGNGGFAQVYEVKKANGTRLACKAARNPRTRKATIQLQTEIMIHRSLNHPNVVRFYDEFWGDRYVYHMLELCSYNSLMEVLPKRCRFTEPEARFFMVQVVGACHYMHTHQVIHHDLKLSNLLLDVNMNIKIADFGLADLMVDCTKPNTRCCGTIDYMAPEVFDEVNGHSFEADIWSIGVILYILIVGFPPFPGPMVRDIRRQILRGHYNFPRKNAPSLDAQALIRQALIRNPKMRPTMQEIVEHAFFTQATVPNYIPPSALDAPPDFGYITEAESQVNLRQLKCKAFLPVNEVRVKSIAISWKMPMLSATSTIAPGVAVRQFQISETVGETVMTIKAIRPRNLVTLLHTKVKPLSARYSCASEVRASFVATLYGANAVYCGANCSHFTFLFNRTHRIRMMDLVCSTTSCMDPSTELISVNPSVEQWTIAKDSLELLGQIPAAVGWSSSGTSKGPVAKFVLASGQEERACRLRKGRVLVVSVLVWLRLDTGNGPFFQIYVVMTA